MSGGDNTVYPGHVIGAIAVASGVSGLEAALGVACVIGGIGGPNTGVVGPAGEFIHGGINLIVAGRDVPSWQRAQELLVEPIIACQRVLRGMSQSAGPERLDHLQFSPAVDHTADVVADSKAGIFGENPRSTNYIDDKRHIAVLRTPTFLLRSPDLDALRKAASETMDGSVLAFYPGGELLGRSKECSETAETVARLVAGTDQDVSLHKAIGPGRMTTCRAHVFLTTSPAELRDALVSGNAGTDRLLRGSLITDPSALPRIPVQTSESIRYGYQSWRERIGEVLDERRAGHGVRAALTSEMRLAMESFAAELQQWHKALPARLQPFFPDLLNLPYRLYSAFMITLARHDKIDWLVPFTLQTTRQLISHQRSVLEALLLEAEIAEHHRARIAMLRKLACGPCVFRDLMRRYSIQRRDVHEPVFRELVTDGCICLRSDGFLELSEQGRKQLLAA